MRTRVLSVFVGFCVLLALVVQPAPAQAAYSIYGKVTRIVDGDTVMVDLWGDGTTTPVAVRNAGIQTMEHNQCHFSQASSAMSRLTLGKKVRLTAAYASSTSQGRPVRFVDVVDSTTTIDSQLAQLQNGHAIALVIPPETWRAAAYQKAMEQAAVAKQNLWDNDFCGYGPSQTAKINLRVNYDGDGDESTTPNSEWVELHNPGTTTVDLQGWVIRTGAQDSFIIPSGVQLKPGALVLLRVGKGSNSATTMYWGYAGPRFPNLTATSRIGSGAYLFDPDGDIRAHQTYPCSVGCTDPATGKVSIRAVYDPPGDERLNPNSEYVEITSLSSAPVDLSFRVLQVGGSTREFGAGSVLTTKGSKLVVRVGTGTSTATTKYWGKTTSLLVNAGGTAVLRSSDAITIACTAWGTGRC